MTVSRLQPSDVVLVASRHRTTRWRPLCCLLLAVVLAGCGRGGPQLVDVSGIVRWQGRPVPVGVVTLVPEDGSGGLRPAAGMIDASGCYRLAAVPGQPGVLPGRYRVAVRASTGSPDEGGVSWLVPQRFADPAKSGLSIEIPVAGRVMTHDIDLGN
jgi:hypothetical protein